jgi:hypothetical protein
LDPRQIKRLAVQIQLKALQSLPIFVMKNGGTYYSSTMLKYILGVEHHPYIIFPWSTAIVAVSSRGKR